MATRHLTRAVLSTTKPLISVISHSYSTAAAVSRRSSFIFRLRPLVAAASASCFPRLAPAMSARGFATRQTSSSLNDPNPNWSNRPPKETILLDGCDFEHWLVVMEPPEGDITRDDIIDSYIKTLATVVGSEEEARMKIYSVSTKHYFAFGALVSEELSYKLKEIPRVRWVLPDSYLDVRNKDYGGEPFINGQAVPYDPKYHEEWVRNNSRANERNRRNDRPRNHDRSRNFERRRDVQMNNQNSGSNFGGPGGGSMGGPQNFSAPPPPPQQPTQGALTSNYGGGMPPQNNPGNFPPRGPPPPNALPQNNPGNFPPRGPPPPNIAPQNQPGNFPPRGPPPPNNGYNYQYPPNGGPPPYQSGPGPNPAGIAPPVQGQNPNNAYAPNVGGGNPYQSQNAPPQPPNMGFGPGQNPAGFAPNGGYGPSSNQNNYGQNQNGYAPSVGGNGGPDPIQGGYGNHHPPQNVPGRDSNY